MENHLISTNAINQLQAGLNQVAEALRKQPHPGWAQMDRLSLQRSVTQTIHHILINIFTQNPKLAPLTRFSLTDQLLFRKALGTYAQLLARTAFSMAHPNPDNTKDLVNKDIFNKKIITAHKFFAAIIVIIYQLQDAQANRDELLKDLRIQLAALAEKEKSETPQYTQTEARDKTPVLVPIIPCPIPEDDEDLLELLETLELTIGATHEDIEAAHLRLTKEFTPEQYPEKHAAFEHAFDILMRVSANRLADMIKITPTEIDLLVMNLQPQSKQILNKDISLRELREIYLKHTPDKELSSSSPITRKLHTTMQKLEHKFKKEPDKTFNLEKEFLDTPELSRLGQTPRPRPYPAIKG